ncbi:uncharacterized protein LOC142172922 [Nicotiana tabacum]|uniref:Uncharacterized protein LOC142172922 n=1 Tax=Nicotiana tabacum TaxID=4097 RepID=A0AC58T7E2_TOBAC
MSTNQNKPFSVREDIPLELHMWWHDLGNDSRKIATKALGGLIGLLKVKPRKDVIEAFADFELTPTLEEIAGYVGFEGNLRSQYQVAPRIVTPHKYLDLLSISRDVRDGNLAKGFCTFYFLYRRYRNPRGFETPDTGLTHAGNQDKWEARRGLAFIVAFLGILVCSRKDGNIEMGLVGIVDFMAKKPNGTIVPLILAEIYRALTRCREGAKFFEGCNMLLQIWMEEHLFHRPEYLNCCMIGLECIEKHEKRVEGYEFPDGTEAWHAHLRSLTVNKIEWTFGWLSVNEVIYMSAEVCFLLLMGLRSIQPYAPHRVCEDCHICEDMTHTTFFAAVMTFVKQIMNDLDRLQRDLAHRPVARPNDVSRAPGTLIYS